MTTSARVPSPALPGADLVAAGLADLAAGQVTEAAMLVAGARERLTELGYLVPETDSDDPEADLFHLITERLGQARAHSAYNAQRRRLVSFLRADKLAPTDR